MWILAFIRFAYLVFLLTFPLFAGEPVRTWTSSDGRAVSELSQAHNSANPPMHIEIGADGFEAALRAKIRRPRGEILQEDYDRVGSIGA